MKILVVQESDWLNNGPHDQHHIAEKLSTRGHEIRVIDFEIGWRVRRRDAWRSQRQVFNRVSKLYDGGQVTVIRPGIVHLRVPGADYMSLVLSHGREIRRQMLEFAPDAIVGLGILNSYLAVRAAKRTGIPFIYYWIDAMHTLIPYKYFHGLGRAIERRVLKQTDITLATNKALRDLTLALGAPPDRTCVFRHGVDFARFDPARQNPASVRRRLGIGAEDIVMTYVGRLSRITGVMEVLGAMAELPVSRLKFLVVGTGSREQQLWRIRDELGLQDRVFITSQRPYNEIPGLLAASDICLLPFHHTALTHYIVPVKLTDYMAMAKPIISTRLPGVVTEFGDYSGITYVERPEDIPAKALEMTTTCNLEEIGARGQKCVSDDSWDDGVSQFEEILAGAIKKRETERLSPVGR